ncbi:dinucleotide-utilizing enzyme possibly involved in molybdopterin or thiamin biosynthesis [Burkholderiales bacterium JOSHI_001]|nr:dinucleotide-utilizing enzyme possibly involved in molybdopterin or thiamin biosynthesis [Burkholderiales bacterium JOSHI_001]
MSKHDRQSFLGATSEQYLKRAKVGVIGLGGGGSHIVQQLAHLGVGNYVLVDPDTIDETNLNRLVGGTLEDVRLGTLKVDIAERVIRSVVADATIGRHPAQWQVVSKDLQTCDVLIGCLDAVAAKDQLDKFCQRFLIPYIDIGMDVHKVGGGFLISGQVVLITPGSPCLRCMGLVTEEALAREARNYGAAGGKPQVVWPNGLLASTAVGLFTQLICPWHSGTRPSAFLEYDGNKGTLTPSKSFEFVAGRPCAHFHAHEAGDPLFDIRQDHQCAKGTAS